MGRGHAVWCARLTCHLTYLRLMTLGLARARRLGLRREMRRRRKVSQLRWQAWGSSGGKVALVGDGLAGDPQCGDEADPVWVVPGVQGCLAHQRPDRVVTAQVAPDLLADQVGGLGAQHGARSALVGLQLIEGDLDLPPLGVGSGHLGRAHLVGIGQGGEQAVAGGVVLAVVDAVVDDPHQHRFLAPRSGAVALLR